MLEKRISIQQGETLALTDMLSDVTIAGWDEPDLLIRWKSGDERDVLVQDTESGPELSARSASELQVPAWLPVSIRQVAGNLTITGLQAPLHADQVRGNLTLNGGLQVSLAEVSGNLTATQVSDLRVMGTVYGDANLQACGRLDLQNVRGNLRVRSTGQATVSRVGGNAHVQDCAGALSAQQIGGNAVVAGVGGPCRLDSVAGNLMAKDLKGGAHVERIGGNLVLNGSLGQGHTYHFRADGNAALRLGEGSGAHLHLKGHGSLVASVPLTDSEREDHTLTGTFGEGGCEVGIEAGGNVVVSHSEGGAGDDLAGEIARQVEESLRAIDLDVLGRQVSDEMEAALSRLRVKMQGVNWDRIGLQGQQTIERAMDRMQENLDRLAEKSARQVEKQLRRQERMESRVSRAWERGAFAAGQHPPHDFEMGDQGEPIPEPDLEEERLTILRMVEQGQVTPEEAEMLLDALG